MGVWSPSARVISMILDLLVGSATMMTVTVYLAVRMAMERPLALLD
jgi:hypothetical protein